MEGSASQNQEGGPIGDRFSFLTSISAPAAQTGGRDSMTPRSSGAPVSSSALDIVKKKLQEAGSPRTMSTHPVPASSDANGLKVVETVISKDKAKDASGDGNMSDSSSNSDDEESGPNKEECIIQFKVIELLLNFAFH